MAHSNKHIRQAIEYAENKGWTFVKSGPRAHAFGVLRCDFGHKGCQFFVYGTPRNPESHSKDIRKQVDNVLEQKDRLMKTYDVTLIATRSDHPAKYDPDTFSKWLEDVAVTLAEQIGGAGPDVSVSGHEQGVRLKFDREASSLSEAIATAIHDTTESGLEVLSGEFVGLALASSGTG